MCRALDRRVLVSSFPATGSQASPRLPVGKLRHREAESPAWGHTGVRGGGAHLRGHGGGGGAQPPSHLHPHPGEDEASEEEHGGPPPPRQGRVWAGTHSGACEARPLSQQEVPVTLLLSQLPAGDGDLQP